MKYFTRFLVVLAVLVSIGLVGGRVTDVDKNKVGSDSAKGLTSDAELTGLGTYPLVKTPITISALWTLDTETPDLETNVFLNWYEDQTNVKIDYKVISEESISKKKNMLLASGDYPEIFVASGISREEEVRYGTEGVFIPLNDLIEEHGYYIKKAFEKYPELKQAMTTPDGNIYSLPMIEDSEHIFYNPKMWINKEWLERLGLEIPTTIEEFQAVLRAFKEQDANGNGDSTDEVPLISAGQEKWFSGPHFLINPFIYFSPADINDHYDFFYLKDGRVAYNAIQPEFKEAIMYINGLIEEGLYDSTGFTMTQNQIKQLQMNGEDGFALIGAYPEGDYMDIIAQREGVGAQWADDYVALSPLIGPEGVQQTPNLSGEMISMGTFVITDKCENPELAFRWADNLLNEEIQYRKYGVEGSEWRKGIEGEVDFNGNTPLMVRTLNESNSNNENNHAFYGLIPGIVSKEFLQSNKADPESVTSQAGIEYWLWKIAVEQYKPYAPEEVYKQPYLTVEESVEVAQLRTAIDSYTQDTVFQFMVGGLDIEDEWDKYVKTIQEMGVNRMVEIYQEAYSKQYKE